MDVYLDELNILGSAWNRLSLKMCRCGSSFLIYDWIYVTAIGTREKCREKLAATVSQLDNEAGWKKNEQIWQIYVFHPQRHTHRLTTKRHLLPETMWRCPGCCRTSSHWQHVRLVGLRFRPKGFFMQTTSVAFRADTHSTAYSHVCVCVCVCLVICAASPPVCTDVVTVHLSARRSLPSVQKRSCL